MCKVSIIVPIYNAEQYIKRCLDALANQSLDDYEVILINDGSTDGTLEILNKYNSKHPNIFKIISTPNGGQGKARNEGVKYAKGEFLAFADSDDFMEPGMYEELYNFAVKFQYDLVVCSYYRVNSQGEICNIELKSLDDITMINTSPWNKLFRRDIWIEKSIYFAEKLWYEDVLAIYQYAFSCSNIGFYNKPLYNYVYREHSSINVYNEKVRDIFSVLDELYSYLEQNKILELKYDQVEAVFILHGILGHLSRCAVEPSFIKRNQYIQEATKYLNCKFPRYLENRYMKLKHPLFKNQIIDYFKWISCKAIYLKVFDILLIIYRTLVVFQVNIRKW